jgi:putative transposase
MIASLRLAHSPRPYALESQRPDCFINAVAESFFATTKGEMIDHEIYQTRAEEKKAIADYIEGFYNHVRRHLAIGFVSPIEFDLNDMIGKSAA